MEVHLSSTQWETLVDTLWDWGEGEVQKVPGVCLVEFINLAQHDYDDIDRLYIQHETIGGG